MADPADAVPAAVRPLAEFFAPAATLPVPLTVLVALGTPLPTPLTELVAVLVPVAPSVPAPAVAVPVALVVAVVADLAALLVSLLLESEVVCFEDLDAVDFEPVLSSAVLAVP